MSDFIEETLIQVIEGVRKSGKNRDYLIAPHTVKFGDVERKLHEPSIIEFEISVSVEENRTAGINKIVIAKNDISELTQHRVTFSVPVYYWGSQRQPSI